MIKNYLLIAVRSMWRNKAFSFINILGLTIGICASLLIFLLVSYDYSFEKQWPNGNRIYRVVSQMHFPEMDFKNSGACGPLAGVLRSDVAGIDEVSAFWAGNPMTVTIPGADSARKFFKSQKDIIFADDHFFRIFPYTWVSGSNANAGKKLNEVVLTESRAKNYFPQLDANQIIGKTILYDDSILCTVQGIVKDQAAPTDMQFKEFISLRTYLPTLIATNSYDLWGSINTSSNIIVKLSANAQAGAVEKNIKTAKAKDTKDDFLKTENFLQPLRDIHFSPDYENFGQRKASKTTLSGLIAVAGFLLLLGCINFINLTTAQSSRRAREIGIRKTMGSTIGQLVRQFLGETWLVTLLAALLAVMILPLALNVFSSFLPDALHFGLVLQTNVIVFLIALIFVVGLLAGLYPAMIVSRFQPALVLKNLAFAGTGQSRKAHLRKVLTVSQFAIAQFFIIATLIVSNQIRYSINLDMGFNKEAIVYFDTPSDYRKPDHKAAQLVQQLKGMPGIQRISLAQAPPAAEGFSITTMSFIKNGKKIETTVSVKSVDTAYLGLYQLKLLAGRNLKQSDTTAEYLINEAYMRFLGYKDPHEIIGHLIDRGSYSGYPIVGVLSDFHQGSTQNAIKPLAISSNEGANKTIHILLAPKGKNTDGWKNTLAKIEKEFKATFPDQAFSYTFLDDSIAKFYSEEQQTTRLLTWSAGLAVLISCLGLFGLVIFTTTQRTKEIGVRKILGATVTQLVTLLSKDYLLLVIIAFVVSAPAAWWAMHQWLQAYVYQTPISWWVFALTALLMLALAFVTMALQTIRSARENPANSLRSE